MNELVKLPDHMTLYEVCKLLGTEHSKAMKRVMPEMLDTQGFGSSPNWRVTVSVGNRGGTKVIETHNLTKRQSLIMAARLSNKFLVKVIDRWQELEDTVNVINSRELSKKEQKIAMQSLQDHLVIEEKGNRINFIKANVVVNKAVCNNHGLPKMIKKDEMSPSMIALRDVVLDDYVKLFAVIGDNSQVKEILYKKYEQPTLTQDNANI